MTITMELSAPSWSTTSSEGGNPSGGSPLSMSCFIWSMRPLSTPSKFTMRATAIRSSLSVDATLRLGVELFQPLPCFANEHRVRLERVVGERDQRLRERPAARAGPGCVVDGELVAEDLAAVRVEELPGHHHVASRVADAHAAEVDHRAQSAVLCEHVARVEVAVDPDRRAIQ